MVQVISCKDENCPPSQRGETEKGELGRKNLLFDWEMAQKAKACACIALKSLCALHRVSTEPGISPDLFWEWISSEKMWAVLLLVMIYLS